MKLIIAILVVAAGTLGVVFNGEADPHRTCQCSTVFCSCSITCLDTGEIPSCNCTGISCSCQCTPKDFTGPTGGSSDVPTALPTMTKDQEGNSRKFEAYLRSNPSGTALADGVKGLRDAILQGDASRYQATAQSVEDIYANLPAAQQNAIDTWIDTNLK